MPTYRKLHVKITDSLDVDSMSSDFVRLTWTWLQLIVCKEGRGMMLPQWLRSKLYPLRADVTDEMIMNAMLEFYGLDMIDTYESGGREYFQIKNWHQYQNTSKDAPSPFPEPTEEQLKSGSRVNPELVESWSIVTQSANADSALLSMSNSKSMSESALKGGVGGNFVEVLKVWEELFPDKPQPRANNQTLQVKLKTRMRSPHFRENWRPALMRAGKSKFLRDGPWFDLGWFLKNDDNYESCLNGKYDGAPSINGQHKQGQRIESAKERLARIRAEDEENAKRAMA